jgi:DnaJ-class molecular chaperone
MLRIDHAFPRWGSPASVIGAMTAYRNTHQGLELIMANEKGPNVKKKQKCKNCEGKGLLKKGDKVVKCQRCGGTGVR